MNIDANFFYTLLSQGEVRALSAIERDWLAESYMPVYDFVMSCLKNPEMKRMPRTDTVEGKFSLEFLPTQEDVWFFVQELRKRKASQIIEETIKNDTLPNLASPTDMDPLAAARKLMEVGCHITRNFRPKDRGDSISFTTDISIRREDYERRKKMQGLIGIPYPWKALNLATGGLVPGELTTLFARSSVGKTWLTNIIATDVFSSGKSVLYVSQEMAPIRVTNRMDSLMAGVSPRGFRFGQLTEDEEKRLDAFYDNLDKLNHGIMILGPKDIKSCVDFDVYLSQIAKHVDLVIWDSCYEVIRKEKWELRAEFVMKLKRASEDYNVPILATWQFNQRFSFLRRMKKDLIAAACEGVAITEAARTDADKCIGAAFSDEENTDILDLFTFKTRDGMQLQELKIHWDIESRKFSAISWDVPGVETFSPFPSLEGDLNDIGE